MSRVLRILVAVPTLVACVSGVLGGCVCPMPPPAAVGHDCCEGGGEAVLTTASDCCEPDLASSTALTVPTAVPTPASGTSALRAPAASAPAVPASSAVPFASALPLVLRI